MSTEETSSHLLSLLNRKKQPYTFWTQVFLSAARLTELTSWQRLVATAIDSYSKEHSEQQLAVSLVIGCQQYVWSDLRQMAQIPTCWAFSRDSTISYLSLGSYILLLLKVNKKHVLLTHIYSYLTMQLLRLSLNTSGLVLIRNSIKKNTYELWLDCSDKDITVLAVGCSSGV